MSRHAGPPRAAELPPVPEPSFAERARTLAHLGRTGTLATLSRRHPGHPFASVMPYALDEGGRPLFLISSMAMHTQNLEADARASLLITQPDWTGDPLAAGRLTLMGEARRLDAADVAGARAAYLARHARARYWVDFDDFALWRLEVADLYYVGGFAAMDWVTAADYRAAEPDPLADAATGIVEHMNRDHAEALIDYARHFAGEAADEATMVAIDRLGFKLRLRQGERLSSVRIAFPAEVRTAAQSRETLIAMLREARAGRPAAVDTVAAAAYVTATKLRRSPMVRVSVLYPSGEGKKFDHDYYVNKHMKLVMERMGPAGLRRYEVDKGVAGAAPGAPAPFICIGHLYFDSVAAWQAAIAPHGKELFADVPNFTNITPQVQIAEIIHS